MASGPPRLIVTIYRLILGAYPARVRRKFGEEQLRLFEDLWRDERPSTRVSGTLWTLGQFWRAIRVGLVCHFDNRRRLNAMSRQSWALPIDRFRPWLSDLRLGARAVRRSPWYSLTSILVLASGVALTTVVFAMVDGVLFRPLPYARADQLFLVRAGINSRPQVRPPAVSGREIATWREAAPEMLATIMRSDIGDVSYFEGRPYRTRTVDERFFEVLGIQPMIGGFTPEDFTWRPDGTADAFRPVLLSHALWQAMFGGDPAAIGKSVVVSEREGRRYGFTLRGVLPEEFVYPLDLGESQPDMLVPFHTREISEDLRLYQLIVRLPDPAVAPGIEARLRGTLRRLAESPSRTSPHEIAHESQAPKALDRVDLLPLTVHLGQRDRPTLALVMSAAALLLLLSCVNLAGLAAARIVERQRDLAVRRALGATTWAVTRALLAEVCVLAGLATLTALAIASPLLSWTVALLPPSISTVTPPIIDVRVFVTAALIGSASAALVVIWPTLIAHRVSRIAGPMDLSRTATRLGRRSKRLIVATQTALGFVLLTAGGLAAVSLANVWRNDAGYRRDRLVLIEAFVKNYSTDADRLDQLIRAREELGHVPGVHRISATTLRMLSDRALPPSSDYVPAHWKGLFPGVDSRRVEADFFDITGLRVIEGTRPTADDWTADRPVAIVSQQAARLSGPAVRPSDSRSGGHASETISPCGSGTSSPSWPTRGFVRWIRRSSETSTFRDRSALTRLEVFSWSRRPARRGQSSGDYARPRTGSACSSNDQ